MTRIKKVGDGYYLMKKRGRRKCVLWTSSFPVRARDKIGGVISASLLISVPEELVGKRLRFKVEVIE